MPEATPGATLHYLLVEPGRCTALAGPPGSLPTRGYLWVACDHEAARTWTEPVHALTGVRIFDDHLLDAENPSHRSYFDSTHEYEMIVFRGLAFVDPDSDPRAPIRIRTRPTVFFVFPRLLVTLAPADDRLVPALRRRLLDSARHHQRLPSRPEELMLRLLNGMVDGYLDLRQPLTEQLERWQRELLDPRRPFQDWLALLEARRELRKLENLSEEQLDALQEWRDERVDRRGDVGEPLDEWAHPAPGAESPVRDSTAGRDSPAESALPPMTDSLQVRVSDLVEHIDRVRGHARRLESSVETAVQLHFAATAHRTSEIIRVLTVLTAIFMPLTLITGVFGMNFEFIPGLHSAHGFWIALGGMLLLALVLLAFFRARRYLSSPGGRAARRRRARGREGSANGARQGAAKPVAAPPAAAAGKSDPQVAP